MPTTFSRNELVDIARIIGAVPPGTSPAVAIRFAARKHHISESALTSALSAIRSGNVPPVTETDDTADVDPAKMQQAVAFAATVNAAEAKPLATASTGDLYALTAAYFG